jgi:RND family efflux transporter MFP subunit
MAQNPEAPSKSKPESPPAKDMAPPEAKATCPLKQPGGSWRILIESLVALAAVVLILLWLSGAFHAKVKPGMAGRPVRPIPPGGTVLAAETYSIPRYEWAIGSIQAVHETALGSKILARVKETNVKAGQPVKEGEVLMRLEDADLKAKVAQAEASVEVATAQLAQAKTEFDRIMKLAGEQAAAAQEISTVSNQYKEAQAKLALGRAALEESRTVLSYAVIRSPFDGRVIDKKVEAGDMVAPGQILLKLYDPKRMQLVATVRESLAKDLNVGQPLQAYIPAMGLLCHGTVAEIVPQAQTESRSFEVKVVGPCAPGVYTGMFGRLLIPLGREPVILIPQAAIENVGQLKLVEVAEGNHLERRSIQIGRTFEDYVEVLSGLTAGETVWIPRKISAAGKRDFAPTYLWEGLGAQTTCPADRAK